MAYISQVQQQAPCSPVPTLKGITHNVGAAHAGHKVHERHASRMHLRKANMVPWGWRRRPHL